MKKFMWLVLLVCDVFFSCVVYSQSVNTELSDNLLRLHVIANSNEEEDILIKYQVRDKINEIIDKRSFENRQEVIKGVKAIENEINSYLSENGISYDCEIICTTASFPKKIYNNIVMPSGRYKCIKAVLGEGKGENWWCIAYPPLCFTESVVGSLSEQGEEKLKEKLSEDVYSLIANSGDNKIRFMSVDLINSFIDYICDKE